MTVVLTKSSILGESSKLMMFEKALLKITVMPLTAMILEHLDSPLYLAWNQMKRTFSRRSRLVDRAV